jgi:ribA/ribD-fused uncharacterized protein
MEGKLLRSATLFAKQMVGKPMGFKFSAFLMINEFKGTNSFLSNFHPWGFTFRGIYMPTAEHAFQAAKAEYDHEAVWIAGSDTPGIAKRRGRKAVLRADWENIKLPIMLEVVTLKFLPEDRRDMLKATEPHELIEGNYWHDQFWGNCMCDQHLDEPGRNYLGKILMHVRKRL